MKHLHKTLALALCLLCHPSTPALAQSTPPFDLQAYMNFLAAHRELRAGELLAMHPSATFTNRIEANLDEVAYLDSINLAYHLTADELALLRQHGFVVSERLSEMSVGDAYLKIYSKDLPVFVSTDVLLHALHKSYDAILIDTELGVLLPRLEELLTKLYDIWPSLADSYAANLEMQPMLNDIEVYVNVTLRLLGKSFAPHRSENAAAIEELLALIAGEQPMSYALFSDTPRTIDFSQFTPRGHYTQNESLKKYFQAMIWLGRTELMLSKPKQQLVPPPSDADIQRQTIDAFLLLEAVKQSGAQPLIDEMDGIIRFLVGESDNITLANLQMLSDEIGLAKASELLDLNHLLELQTVLKEKSYAIQRINSQILISDPMDPEQIAPPSAFLLLGQRFVIDSYVMGEVVYDRILHQGAKVWRPLPSSLDVLFALGNDASAILLQDELEQYHYSPNLVSLRYLIDSYEENFWSGSLYNVWLQAIRTLNPPQNLSPLPPFMQTGAFWQEKMNSQLAAWAQLRHDNLLYAKQSYTGGSECSYPYSYVEPFPEFYRTLKNFAVQAQANFATVNFPDAGLQYFIIDYFERMAAVMDTLTKVAEKELRHEPLDSGEISFLQNVLYDNHTNCVPVFTGWYPRLFYASSQVCGDPDLVIADVHTQPTDLAGNPVGHVMHAGTGPFNLAIIIAEAHNGAPTAFIGPVMSYYEHVTTNFKRLTDEEWLQLYDDPPSFRPAWTNVYLADAQGNSRGVGPQLVTGVKNPLKQNPMPSRYLLHQNYPNPFNAGTLIRFDIPATLANEKASLAIYNMRGELVYEFLDRPLGANTYFARWDGRNNSGRDVASGVYVCRLKVGEVIETRKLSLLR